MQNTLRFLMFLLLSVRFISMDAQEQFSSEALQNPGAYRDVFEEQIPIKEVEVYHQNPKAKSVLLENGYATHVFQNNDWPPQGEDVLPTAVNIIFSKYPKDRSFWLTDYHWLLAKRLQALFALDPRFNDVGVTFTITLQTACDNEFEAMQLFHGMELFYKPIVQNSDTTEAIQDEPTNSNSSKKENISQSKKIERFMKKEVYTMDSVVYNIMENHPEWQEATLVIDWTGSMYGHAAEAVLWHALNQSRSGIKQIVFFNDGDRKPTRKKEIGSTGGIYVTDAAPVSKPLKLFERVKNKGNGGDSPENDIEAIITAINANPKAGEIVLVADNRSCVRDFSLISCIDRPIRIVLCDTEKGINHQYINLAWRTGGSLHTKELDLYDIHSYVEGDSLKIGDAYFTLSPDGWILPADRLGGGYGYCTRYYKETKRKSPVKRRKEPACYFTE